MPKLAPIICVSLLRIVILLGLICCSFSIVQFIESSWRSLLFWMVVAITNFFYFKASFTDPGSLKVCPSEYLAALESNVGIGITRRTDSKVQRSIGRLSSGEEENEEDEERGIGYTRVRKKLKPLPTHLSTASSWNEHREFSSQRPRTQRSVRVGFKNAFLKKTPFRSEGRRIKNRGLSVPVPVPDFRSGRQHRDHRYAAIDQCQWNEEEEDMDEETLWLEDDALSHHRRKADAVIDFAIDSSEDDGDDTDAKCYAELSASTADGHSDLRSNGGRTVNQPGQDEKHWSQRPSDSKRDGLLHEGDETKKNFKSFFDPSQSHSSINPSRKPAREGVELTPVVKGQESGIANEDKKKLVDASAGSARLVYSSSPADEPSNGGSPYGCLSTTDQAHANEGFSSVSVGEMMNGHVWRRKISDCRKGRRTSRRHSDVPFPCTPHVNPCSSYPHPASFIKHSLGQVGLASETSTVSGTVGAVLTYAIAGSAAVPLTAMSLAANQIATTALSVLDGESDISRACQLVQRSTRDCVPIRIRNRESDEAEIIGRKTGTTTELSVAGDTPEWLPHLVGSSALRGEPIRLLRHGVQSVFRRSSVESFSPQSISIPIEVSDDDDDENVSRFKSALRDHSLTVRTREASAVQSNQPSSPPAAVASSANELTTSLCPLSLSTSRSLKRLDPSVLRYRHVMTKTPDGSPCQCRIVLRFCRVCKKFQPLRTRHCIECGFCVRTMDHHCPWLGTCVGESNRIWFYLYLLSQSVELAWTMLEVAIVFVELHSTLDDVDNVLPIIFKSTFLVLIFMTMLGIIVMVICLVSYHTLLALNNLTTWESISWRRITYLKHLPEEKGSPFDGGIRSNLGIYCCPPTFWSCLRYPFVKYVQVGYGPDLEVIWVHQEQPGPWSLCCGC